MAISRFLFTLILISYVFLLPGEAKAAGPEITSEAAILVDLASGRVLYEKNPERVMYPASTTKVLTALLAVRMSDLNDLVTMSENAVHAGGSAIWSTPGEELTVESLLWAIMLKSGNDAATALAEHMAGLVENFAELMNEESRRLGANHSNFVNPHGLHDDDHYTTARDLALIARAAMEEPLIRTMAATRTREISRADPKALSLLINTNKLLWNYEGTTGLKTGYTSQAGHCLIAVAERDERTLLSVVLKSGSGQVWSDTTALLDYGFYRFREVVLVNQGERVGSLPVVRGDGEVRLQAESDLTYVLSYDESAQIRWEIRLDRELVAPLRQGEKVGTLTVRHGAGDIGQVPLVVGQDVVRAGGWYRSLLTGGLLAGGLVIIIGLIRFSNQRRRRSRYYFRSR